MMQPTKKGEFEGDDSDNFVRKISLLHPITDFKEMMSNRREDLVDSAVTQMESIISRLIDESTDGSHYTKAIDCLIVLREGCLVEEEIEKFNALLVRFQMKYRSSKDHKFWTMIIKKGNFFFWLIF